MRGIVLAVVVAMVVGCGGGQKKKKAGSGSGSEVEWVKAVDESLGCTPQARFDAAECKAAGKDCEFGPALVCGAQPVPQSIEEARNQSYNDGKGPCVCTCEEDRVRCATVP